MPTSCRGPAAVVDGVELELQAVRTVRPSPAMAMAMQRRGVAVLLLVGDSVHPNGPEPGGLLRSRSLPPGRRTRGRPRLRERVERAGHDHRGGTDDIGDDHRPSPPRHHFRGRHRRRTTGSVGVRNGPVGALREGCGRGHGTWRRNYINPMALVKYDRRRGHAEPTDERAASGSRPLGTKCPGGSHPASLLCTGERTSGAHGAPASRTGTRPP